MAFAIFWLPLIAGLLLGGVAVGAWYGGDKTLAVWIGFAGAVLLLLTAALQIQQFVWTVTNQPHLVLLPSETRSFLRWDPPHSFQMQVNDIANPDYGAWKVPTLKVRNTGVVAQDATIKWGVTAYEVEGLVASSKRLQDVKATVEPKRIIFSPKAGPGSPFVHPLELSATVPVTFITRETSIYIPIDVWENAALFFIATLADTPNAKSEPFFFDAQISWNIPEGGQPKRFRIKATARNAKLAGASSPVFLADIDLEVSEEN